MRWLYSIIVVFLFSCESINPAPLNEVNSLTDEEFREELAVINYLRDEDEVLAFEKITALQSKLVLPVRRFKALGLKMIVSEELGLNDLAYELAIEALQMGETLELSEIDKVAIYQNLGWIYEDIDENSLAQSYFHKAKSIVFSAGADSLKQEALYCLGSHYMGEDSAVYYLSRSLNYADPIEEAIEDTGYLLIELAEAYLHLGKRELAFNYLNTAKQYEDLLSSYSQGAIKYVEAIDNYYNGDFGEAIVLLDEVITVVDDLGLGNTEEGVNLHTLKALCAESLKDFELAAVTLRELDKRKSEWISVSKNRAVKAFEIQHQAEQREVEIADQRAELSKQRTLIIISVITILITLSVLLVVLSVNKKIKFQKLQIETLMRELHHRVKNNLQVISSLLGLQSSKLEDASAQKAVEEGQERIRAMSLIHQKLYQQDDVSSVDVKEYLETLVTEISESYGYASKAELKIRVPKIPMDVDTTMPLGLIVNELVSNSFKYAFQEIEKPILELELIENPKGSYLFSVKDNGSGLPSGFSLEKASSFGLKLVRLLVRQLDANLEIDQSEGLAYKIEFQAA